MSKKKTVVYLDLAGQRFGALVAVERVGFNVHRKSVWKCKCDCGYEVVIVGSNLTAGNSKSCGCVANDAASKRASKRNYKHGHASGRFSSEYRSWHSMKGGCQYPSVKGYADYGGRGISVCERWQSFENFLADMGLKPSPKHTIDREDVNGNYEPGNCRWATPLEQAANKRATIHPPRGEKLKEVTKHSRRGGTL